MTAILRHTPCRPVPAPAHTALAIRIADYARKVGLRVPKLLASRVTWSRSRYIFIADRLGRPWVIRVAMHHRRGPSVHDTPHFDLVSPDGVAGFDQAAAFIDRIASGEAEWTDPAPAARGKSR